MQRLVAPRKVHGFGKLSQTAGTAIVRSVYPYSRMGSGRLLRTRVTTLVYTAGATAHTLTVMRPFGQTTLTAAAASGQAVINIAADVQAPSAAGALAANDYVVLELSDGTFQTAIVSSVSTLAITLTANLNAAMLSGAYVWVFGVAADHTGNTYALAANATTTLDETFNDRPTGWGFVESLRNYEPILFHSNNATDAGSIDQVSVSYANV